MKSPRRSILSMLDDSVRWTGMPARVANQMSNDPDRKHGPLRWTPIWPIAFAFALLVISLAWPPILDGVSPGALIGIIVAFWGAIAGVTPGILMTGPLGKSSLEDDEREAALRKDSWVFCLALLAVLNGLGQPVFMILSHWKGWPMAQTGTVVTTTVMLNATLLGCLPTLYASWNLRELPKE